MIEARSTSSRYRIARLKRDHPAIAEGLAHGDYPSVHAACKAAGLVPTPTRPLANKRAKFQMRAVKH